VDRIKILYTQPNFDTAGSGKVVYDLVKHLDKSRFAPEICVFHKRGKFFSEVEKLGVPIHVFKFEAAYRPFLTLPARILKISKFFKSLDVDLIHSWHWSSDFTEAAAAKLAGIPYVYTKKAMGWGNRAWTWRSKLSTRVIAINDDMMTEFFDGTTIDAVRLPLGVDLDYYDPDKTDVSDASDLKVKDGQFTIISVVNMVPVKGIQYLLEAVTMLEDIDVKVYIVGNDNSDYADGLKKQYSDERFVFLGKKLDVRPYIKKADLFVIPTLNEGRKEGMPVAPLEAMAMGTPVLGSRIPGIKDVLMGFPERLFNPADAKDLSRSIATFRKSYQKADRNKSSAELRRYVLENFSLKQFISSREEIYSQMVNNK